MKLLKTALIAALPLAFAAAASADGIVTTPQPAGNTLTVASVTISHNGWLVIHAMKNGKPVVPASIGHVAIKAGTTKDVVVKLSTPTKAGQTVLTMLHVDNGVIGKFEFPGADHPVMENGKPVVKPMKID